MHPTGLVPLDSFNDGMHRAALLRLGEWVVDHGIDADGDWRAARDLLLRRPPRAGQPPGADLCRSGRARAGTRLGAWPPQLDHDDPRHPGTAGIGEDVHRARG